MGNDRARLILADDHALVLEGLIKLLEPEFEVVGRAQNGRELIELCEQLKPDGVLLDVSMPMLNGLDAIRRIAKILPRAKMLVVTVHSDAEYVTEAFRAGASGYVLKRSAVSELVLAVRQVLNGMIYVTPLVTQHLVDAVLDTRQNQPIPRLSPRQREVLQLVAEGYTAKEIATVLHISVKTVEFHKGALSSKLGLHNSAEMTKYAIEHGMSGVGLERGPLAKSATAGSETIATGRAIRGLPGS
jgi:DNA-binding NarL/FixJ family response regulator